MQAEWIFTGGPILSGHVGWQPAEAIAVSGGRILAFGTQSEVLHTRGPKTRMIDLAGRALLPGLVDAHIHILGYAITLDRLHVGGLPNMQALRDAVSAEAAKRPAGDWIVGRGWDQDRWPERREPTREDLDLVSPHHPVWLLRNCNHVGVANSAALRRAGITKDTPDPEGGKIDRDPWTEEPTGVLRERALLLVQEVVPSVPHERRRTLLRRAIEEALSYGITQVHTDDVLYAGGLDLAADLFGSMIGPERLPFRVTQMIPISLLKEATARGIATRSGDEWYRYGQVKIFADGSLGGRTAALIAPYDDDPTTKGIYIYPEDEFKRLVVEAHTLGNQVGSHCIGDGAARLFIEAVAEAQRFRPREDARHRMIHCQILSEALMDEMRDHQIIADVQPIFLKSDGYWFVDRVGAARAKTSYAWKSLLSRSIVLCGGSDCPIEPLNIWRGVFSAVARQDLNGYPPGGWNPAEALTVAETLDMYTTGASYSTFEEGFKGSLQPNMAADLVIVDRNPFTCEAAALKDIAVNMTMVGGRVAYEA